MLILGMTTVSVFSIEFFATREAPFRRLFEFEISWKERLI